MLPHILRRRAGVLRMITSSITIIRLPLPLKVFASNNDLHPMLLTILWLPGLQMYHLDPKKNYISLSPGMLHRLWLTSLPLHITTRSFVFRHLGLIYPISPLISASRKFKIFIPSSSPAYLAGVKTSVRPAVFRRRGVLNWHGVGAFFPLRVGVAGQGKAGGVFSSVSIKFYIIIIIKA